MLNILIVTLAFILPGAAIAAMFPLNVLGHEIAHPIAFGPKEVVPPELVKEFLISGGAPDGELRVEPIGDAHSAGFLLLYYRAKSLVGMAAMDVACPLAKNVNNPLDVFIATAGVPAYDSYNRVQVNGSANFISRLRKWGHPNYRVLNVTDLLAADTEVTQARLLVYGKIPLVQMGGDGSGAAISGSGAPQTFVTKALVFYERLAKQGLVPLESDAISKCQLHLSGAMSPKVSALFLGSDVIDRPIPGWTDVASLMVVPPLVGVSEAKALLSKDGFAVNEANPQKLEACKGAVGVTGLDQQVTLHFRNDQLILYTQTIVYPKGQDAVVRSRLEDVVAQLGRPPLEITTLREWDRITRRPSAFLSWGSASGFRATVLEIPTRYSNGEEKTRVSFAFGEL